MDRHSGPEPTLWHPTPRPRGERVSRVPATRRVSHGPEARMDSHSWTEPTLWQRIPRPSEGRVSRVQEAGAIRVVGRHRAGREPQAANRPAPEG